MSLKIGIVAWKTGENSIGITSPYYDFFSQFGAVQSLYPNEEVHSDLNLLVLPGGADVNPLRYGQIPEIYTGNSDIFKESFDINKLPGYVANKTPIFSICRGLQTLNVFFGGALIQNASHAFYSKERDELVHHVLPIRNGEVKGASFKVNSMHHQCIDPNKLGTGMNVILRSKTDDIIEGLAHAELPIAGVQFHPKHFGASLGN